MASSSELEQLQQKEIRLDLSRVPPVLRSRVKQEIGQFATNQILREVATGNSPVLGEGRFQRLSKVYAKKQKQGNRTPNLQLNGFLMAALGFKNSMAGVVVGVMSASQRPKADGHNNLSGRSSLPRRRYIPSSGQDFKRIITSGIRRIIRESEAPITSTKASSTNLALKFSKQTKEETSVTLDTIRGTAIDRLLRGNNGS